MGRGGGRFRGKLHFNARVLMDFARRRIVGYVRQGCERIESSTKYIPTLEGT